LARDEKNKIKEGKSQANHYFQLGNQALIAGHEKGIPPRANIRSPGQYTQAQLRKVF